MKKFLLPCSPGLCCRVVMVPETPPIDWLRLQHWHERRRWLSSLTPGQRKFHRAQFIFLAQKNRQTRNHAWNWERLCEAYRGK
jgi:hypothetical protein